VGVEVAQVVRRDGPELVEQPSRQLEVGGEVVAVRREQLAEHVAPVEPDRAHPGQVVEPHLVDEQRSGSTSSSRAAWR
jgi:hypothetical protein